MTNEAHNAKRKEYSKRGKKCMLISNEYKYSFIIFVAVQSGLPAELQRLAVAVAAERQTAVAP